MIRHVIGPLLFAMSLVVAAASSFGQQEQWLRYCTSSQVYDSIGAETYQSATMTASAPADLRVPKLKAERPLFFRWKCPAGKDGGVWFALDRSNEAGPYDRLYADVDCDGDLAEHAAIETDEASSDDSSRRAWFRRVKVLLPGQDGPTAYHLSICWRSGGGNISIYSACWYEGPVTVGGKSLWCTLIDANANGRFDDRADGTANRDKIRLAAKGDRSFFNSETDRVTRYVGKYVEVEDKLYAPEVSPDGAFVKLSPAGDVAAGSVRLPEGVSEVALLSKDGHFIRKPKDGLLSVPVGEYRVIGWQAGRTDKDGKAWQLLARNTSDGPVAVSVVGGKEAALDIAEPIQSRASLSRQGDEYVINQELRGRGGESVSLRCTGEQPPAPKVRIVNGDRSYDRTYSMEYG